MIIIGLDPSLTSAGIAILDNGTPTLLASIGHPSQGRSFAHRSRRIVSQCRAIVNALPERADLVVIEEPAWGINMPSAHDRAGLWWGLYSALTAKGHTIAVVNPKTRAKWASGTGAASKTQVLEAVRTTWAPWRLRITNDDVADALTLAEIGARHVGEELHFMPRRRHIEALAGMTLPVAAPVIELMAPEPSP